MVLFTLRSSLGLYWSSEARIVVSKNFLSEKSLYRLIRNFFFEFSVEFWVSLTHWLKYVLGGRHGNQLRYVAVVVNTSLTGSTLKYNDGKEVYQNWEKFTKREVSYCRT